MKNIYKRTLLNIGFLVIVNSIVCYGFSLDFKFLKLATFDFIILGLTQIYTYIKNKFNIEL